MDEESKLNLDDEKLKVVRKLLNNIRDEVDSVVSLLSEDQEVSVNRLKDVLEKNKLDGLTEEDDAGSQLIIEGVFDGQNMIGPDGKQYTVPANYASKSKLVEGDILKLTIASNGSFIYKQISPIARDRLVGTLIKDDETGSFYVVIGEKKWRVLTASVTYFNGDTGDEGVILVPKEGKSKWAAVENVIKK